MLNLSCYGATGEVTGSCHLVRVGEYQILLDCGMFQGGANNEARNHRQFPFSPAEIDVVVLSHAHIDHSGLLPSLVKQGFSGPIYTHHATRDLCDIMLKDSAFLQEKGAEWENRKRVKKGLPRIEALYSEADANAAVQHIQSLSYNETRTILPGVNIRLQDAGHILGSAIIELWLADGARKRKLVFSGDLGHVDSPILNDPATIDQADLVIMESTYGDRLHRSWAATHEEIMSVVADATRAKGNVLIPAFAVGRSQMVLSWMAEYFDEANLDRWHIFLDSPMAIRATAAYTHHTELYDSEAKALWERNLHSPLLPNLHMTESTEASMAINNIRSGAIIIAGSGMCTGGRIKHHLKNNVWRRECHVIIVGYQAGGTIGRALADGTDHINLWGDRVKVAAKVHTIGGLSAHADQNGLIDWYSRIADRPPLLLVHGEPLAQQKLAERIKQDYAAPVHLARNGEVIDLEHPGFERNKA